MQTKGERRDSLARLWRSLASQRHRQLREQVMTNYETVRALFSLGPVVRAMNQLDTIDTEHIFTLLTPLPLRKTASSTTPHGLAGDELSHPAQVTCGKAHLFAVNQLALGHFGLWSNGLIHPFGWYSHFWFYGPQMQRVSRRWSKWTNRKLAPFSTDCRMKSGAQLAKSPLGPTANGWRTRQPIWMAIPR